MKEINVEFLKSELEKMFESRSNQRSIRMMTGPGGAAFGTSCFEIATKEFLLGRELSEEEKQAIHTEVESRDWQPGTYEVSDDGVKYLGLFDKDMKDGMYAIKSDDKYYVERWKNGARVEWEEISEEKFEELKKQNNE